MTKKFKPAFTLAEVLITLAIVGVVAALTLPNLIADYKKKSDVVKLKKAYSTLQQAWRRSEVDNGPSEHWEDSYTMGAQAYFEKYWKPYFNNPVLCETYQDCGYESNFPHRDMLGASIRMAIVHPGRRISFYLPDGTLYVIYTAGGAEDAVGALNRVLIDINGAKLPNTYGRDTFIFERVASKGILPFGYNYSISELENNCLHNGIACARKIMSEGWKMNY